MSDTCPAFRSIETVYQQARVDMCKLMVLQAELFFFIEQDFFFIEQDFFQVEQDIFQVERDFL